MISINWLHLTDFHQGMSGQSWLWPTMRSEFFQDLSRLQEKVGSPWDLVLFTGDLTQTGTPDEFKALEDNLGRLWEQLEKFGSKPMLLAVPGNHDLVRPPPKSPAVKAFVHGWDDLEIQDEFWKTEPNDYNQLVHKAFAPYVSWQHSSCFHSKDLSPGCLPGDFAFTFKKGDFRLGVVGLNSAFLQLTGGDYEKRLALDSRQFHAVCQGDSADWVAQHDATIILTHHPEDWLKPTARQGFERDILARDNFTVHLHGHMHIPATQSKRSGGGVPRRTIQGASLFGLEEYGETKKIQRIHGYGAGKFEFSDTHATLHYWPRSATEKQGRYYRLGADPSADLDENEKWSETFGRRARQRDSSHDAQVRRISSRHEYFLRAYRYRLRTSFGRSRSDSKAMPRASELWSERRQVPTATRTARAGVWDARGHAPPCVWGCCWAC